MGLPRIFSENLWHSRTLQKVQKGTLYLELLKSLKSNKKRDLTLNLISDPPYLFTSSRLFFRTLEKSSGTSSFESQLANSMNPNTTMGATIAIEFLKKLPSCPLSFSFLLCESQAGTVTELKRLLRTRNLFRLDKARNSLILTKRSIFSGTNTQ